MKMGKWMTPAIIVLGSGIWFQRIMHKVTQCIRNSNSILDSEFSWWLTERAERLCSRGVLFRSLRVRPFYHTATYFDQDWAEKQAFSPISSQPFHRSEGKNELFKYPPLCSTLVSYSHTPISYSHSLPFLWASSTQLELCSFISM